MISHLHSGHSPRTMAQFGYCSTTLHMRLCSWAASSFKDPPFEYIVAPAFAARGHDLVYTLRRIDEGNLTARLPSAYIFRSTADTHVLACETFEWLPWRVSTFWCRAVSQPDLVDAYCRMLVESSVSKPTLADLAPVLQAHYSFDYLQPTVIDNLFPGMSALQAAYVREQY